jgi:type IV pilus assembly protein PilY1
MIEKKPLHNDKSNEVVNSNANSSSIKSIPLMKTNNKVADDLVVHAGDDAKIRIIGGAPGEEVILKDDGNNQPTRCTGAGQCSEGADEAEMDMTPKKIYLYEDEPQ